MAEFFITFGEYIRSANIHLIFATNTWQIFVNIHEYSPNFWRIFVFGESKKRIFAKTLVHIQGI